MTVKKVLITGARGQLAVAIADVFSPELEVKAYSREQLDITDFDAVMARVSADSPEVIVNCAAYNDVDRAEDDPGRALLVNAFGVRVLARAARDLNATLVHYSTDFVFDGRTSRPYREEDRPNPLGVYAASKLTGEWFAAEAPRAFIVRVESLFGGKATSSVDRIVQAITEGREAKVFADRVVSPTYVVDLASATRALIERGEPGLYHCVNSGYGTWYDVGLEVVRLLGKEREAKLCPVAMDSVRLRAARPKFAALAADKLKSIIMMPTWQDALRRHLT